MLSLYFFVSPTQSGSVFGKRASADFIRMAMHEVKVVAVENHLNGIEETRKLTEVESHLKNLNLVAAELKIEKFSASTPDLNNLHPGQITDAIIKKIQENPKWDVALSSQNLMNIKKYEASLQTNLRIKSYGWAWILKQRGQTSEAKKILSELFEAGYQRTMSMDMHNFGTSPLADLQFIQSALEPMSDVNEQKMLESKMQKVKNHYSNLPPSNIQT